MNIMWWSLRIKHLKLQVNGQVSPEDCPVLHNSLLSAHRHINTAIILFDFLPFNTFSVLGVCINSPQNCYSRVPLWIELRLLPTFNSVLLVIALLSDNAELWYKEEEMCCSILYLTIYCISVTCAWRLSFKANITSVRI